MTTKSGYEKMVSGELYEGPDWDLIAMQVEAKKKLDRLNAAPSWDMANRTAMLRDQLGSFGESFVLSPITWEYGKHIHIGDGVFINFECVFLDGADVRIGDGTAIAPRVMFLTAGHPVDPVERQRHDPVTGTLNGAMCINKPITIGKNCWIGAGTMIVGGVTIGDGTTIGAGSVVTRDIPPGVLAAGNPCRVIRPASAKTTLAANAA
ncbi:sugar O-acetyltransferase [Devosia sp. ZB163]|uniref:sugar O-acetyltransferase n=1 Tax=Devosia sp. ZB163 TaxID=3025938 RepID=UPI00236240C1|nr:sugar O-acetyltransferase [Devosia sp. ZB163]MDC9826452.1 sugar O-acetyltransferase [Devosia sp. ZB163]